MIEKVLFLIPTILAENTQSEVLPREIEDTIKRVKVYFAEDIRSARRFISSLKLGIVIDELKFQVLDKNSTFEETLGFLKGQNSSVGVLSEAGSPAIADPGNLAVQAAHQLSWKVKPLVGPNSMLLALMSSGFSGQSFAFNGYLPIDKTAQEKIIKELIKRVEKEGQTQLFMETPYRNNQVLKNILDLLPNNMGLCIACDLTAKNELIISKLVAGWKKQNLPDLHKRPTVFLIGRYN